MALKRPSGIKIKDHTFNRRMLGRLLLESKYVSVTGAVVTPGQIDSWFG